MHRRLAGLAILGVGVLAAAGIGSTPAQAAPPLSAAVQAAAVPQANTVAHRLGSRSGGVYLDRNGHAVVTVTSAAAARTVRAAGLRSRVVHYSAASLTSTKNRLDRLAGVPDTAWGIDTARNQVVVTISDSAPKAGAARVLAAARRYGSEVRVEHSTGHFSTYVRGGDAIQNDQARCSDGFNVRRNGRLMVLTAGHCTNLGGTWYPMGGQVVASYSPGADEGLIDNPSGSGPSQVNTGQTISYIGQPTQGEYVVKSGSTTGVTSGSIEAVDQTVNFDVGVIYHLFATNVYSDHGDSGGPGYNGSTALGTLTGGDTQTTFFYPAWREFNDYGLTLP
ncbi:peptidase [Actinocatenispora thailandica]|uniref:Peptidase n=1 Tax=Actinocatenispora thailandica TaxID=227318 RepID=A0A7R7DSU7_9ACTN|nr:S1 family peptidase [Actinocatenispora thailandica]BCJ37230.1 peptidase [Actinocatenispora thailandica]